MGNDANATVMLEGSREIAILFRAENHQITKIRVASTECTLDAGGLPFLWLTNVKPVGKRRAAFHLRARRRLRL